jgi:ABC-type multidrug transport system fused ATPase/permease subunit
MLIVGAFTKIGKQLETFYDLLAGVDKLGMLLDLPLEPHDKLQAVSGSQPAQVALHQASVEIDARIVLPEISVSIPSGSLTAIVGPPGTGKSLIADLICGLRMPATGYVELDGVDLRSIQLGSLRRNVAISRGADVFQGSVDENVRLQRSYVTSDAVRTALKTVDLLDFVTHLPHGIDTSLQTGGRPLTDSQVNRLMLARALAGMPRLLLIDGGLDCFEEKEAKRLLSSIRATSNCTIVVLTGRPSIASLCEHVIQVGKSGDLAKSG